MKLKDNCDGRRGAPTGALGLIGLILVATVLTSKAQETRAANEAMSDPEAIEFLTACGSWLKAAAQFTVRAEILADETYGEDTKVQVASRGELSVKRPDRFKVIWRSDTDEKVFVHDGKDFELGNLNRQRYAVIASPGDNDAAVGFATSKLKVVIPLSDLIFSQGAYTLEEVESAVYVGKSTIRGVTCHQILVIMDNIDFQVWIDAGERPLMRKYILTYKTLPGSPQYSAELSDWNFNPTFGEKTFELGLGAAAKRSDFVMASEEEL